ncbi:MAG: spondin domain-containing protein, partial [Planctomycetota bacterium]
MNKYKGWTKPAYAVFTVACAFLLGATASAQAQTQEVIVTIENLAPKGGVYFTPVWLGFHDGSYDLFDRGGLATEGLERVAEDGDGAALRAEFTAAVGGSGGIDDVVTAPEGFAGAPVFDPGDTTTAQYTLDSTAN